MLHSLIEVSSICKGKASHHLVAATHSRFRAIKHCIVAHLVQLTVGTASAAACSHTESPCANDNILDRSHHSPLVAVKYWVAITAIIACLQHTTALCSSSIIPCMTADHVHITSTQFMLSMLHATAKACASICMSAVSNCSVTAEAKQLDICTHLL